MRYCRGPFINHQNIIDHCQPPGCVPICWAPTVLTLNALLRIMPGARISLLVAVTFYR